MYVYIDNVRYKRREPTMTEQIHELVRDRYARSAISFMEDASSNCCGPDCCGSTDTGLYSALERAELPEAAALASLGCGNPIAVAELHEGERVLDLGSGGGIDVLLSAKRVGPSGRVFGLDMTDEMLALAQRNIAEAGATNVDLLRGHIENVPLPANSIDVVISNCVVNLAADKPAVFREIARVLKPGGRIGITDIVADDSLTTDERAKRGSYVGCIAGALSFSEFEAGLRAAGLTDVTVTPTHSVADGMHSAIVKATKPAERAVPAEGDVRAAAPLASSARAVPVLAGTACCGDGCCP
jgi:arsenite methyltransferase